jgi:hypothetical protein
MDSSISSKQPFLAEQQWDMTQAMQVLVRVLQQELEECLQDAGRYVLALEPTFVAKVKGWILGGKPGGSPQTIQFEGRMMNALIYRENS